MAGQKQSKFNLLTMPPSAPPRTARSLHRAWPTGPFLDSRLKECPVSKTRPQTRPQSHYMPSGPAGYAQPRWWPKDVYPRPRTMSAPVTTMNRPVIDSKNSPRARAREMTSMSESEGCLHMLLLCECECECECILLMAKL